MDDATRMVLVRLAGLGLVVGGVTWIVRSQEFAEYHVRRRDLGPEWIFMIRMMIYVSSPLIIILGLAILLFLPSDF